MKKDKVNSCRGHDKGQSYFWRQICGQREKTVMAVNVAGIEGPHQNHGEDEEGLHRKLQKAF